MMGSLAHLQLQAARMSSDTLPVSEFRGSPAACGAAYGARFDSPIMGFIKAEVDPTKSRLEYAARCWKHVARSAPHAAEFLLGMSDGSGLPRDHLTMLTLHEEIYHQPHCTALVVTGNATGVGALATGALKTARAAG